MLIYYAKYECQDKNYLPLTTKQTYTFCSHNKLKISHIQNKYKFVYCIIFQKKSTTNLSLAPSKKSAKYRKSFRSTPDILNLAKIRTNANRKKTSFCKPIFGQLKDALQISQNLENASHSRSSSKAVR